MYQINENIAIQDTYGERFQHCWGCGPQNSEGLKLKSYPSVDGDYCIAIFRPDSKYTGGVPANIFGGLIAALFDCHGTASAAWFSHKNKGFKLEDNAEIGRFITARIEVDYKKPLPVNEDIKIVSEVEELSERKVIVKMSMEAAGEIRAGARIVAVAVKDTM